jgi:hypothetical protein
MSARTPQAPTAVSDAIYDEALEGWLRAHPEMARLTQVAAAEEAPWGRGSGRGRSRSEKKKPHSSKKGGVKTRVGQSLGAGPAPETPFSLDEEIDLILSTRGVGQHHDRKETGEETAAVAEEDQSSRSSTQRDHSLRKGLCDLNIAGVQASVATSQNSADPGGGSSAAGSSGSSSSSSSIRVLPLSADQQLEVQLGILKTALKTTSR